MWELTLAKLGEERARSALADLLSAEEVSSPISVYAPTDCLLSLTAPEHLSFPPDAQRATMDFLAE